MRTPFLPLGRILLWVVLAALTPRPALAASGRPLDVDAAADRFLLDRAAAIDHAADGSVLAPRLIAFPGAPAVAVLWDEQTGRGAPTSWYAISLDGDRFERVRPASHVVALRYARFDPLLAIPEVDGELMSDPASELCIVQCVTRPFAACVDAIRAAGGQVHIFLPDQALVVRVPVDCRDAVRQLPFVRWVGPLHPAYKLEEELLTQLQQRRAVAPRRYSVMLYERGAEAQERVAAAIRAAGGEVHGGTPAGFRLEATLDRGQVIGAARLAEVMFIDRKGAVEADMDIVRAIGGGNFVHQTLGFVGTGVRGEIVDTELQLDHPEWAYPPIVHLPGADTVHGTRIYGILFAQGLVPQARGLLPDGQGIYAYCRPLLGGGPTRYEHTAELVDPAGPYRAVFQTTSTGDELTTEYTTISAEMDDILFLYDLLATQSQSNSGDQLSRPQAWAKNIVACGGIKHFNTLDRSDDSWDGYASIGPASDGRVKPDFAHFCENVYTTTVGSGYIAYGSGTSVATPIVAGHFGLLFQMWHAGVFPDFGGGASVFDDRPHMTTAKALLVNTAFRYDWHVPGPNSDLDRCKQGWGMPDLVKLYEARDRMLIVNETDLIAPFEVRGYAFTVGPDDTELRVTMIYADPRGNVGAAHHRINDLSLRAVSPTGIVYWGNQGLSDGNLSLPGGSSNTIDTVENVFLDHPEQGAWTIEVLADEIHEDGHLETPALDADFALVAAVKTTVVIPEIPVLHDSGPLVSHPGQGYGGADASVRHSQTLGEQYMGYGHHVANGSRVADDFEATESWIVQAIDFYAYQVGAGAYNPTITAVNVRLWDGSPMDPLSTVVYGDTLTNLMVSTVWDSLYRTDETDIPTATNRAVYRNRCLVPDWTLAPGVYWVDWQSDGTLESGPFVPPISIAGQTHPPGANAVCYDGGGWSPAVDPGSQTPDGFKFVIRGVVSDTTLSVAGPVPELPCGRLAVRPDRVRPAATITYSLARGEPVSLRLYDVAGRLVRVLLDRPMGAGTWSLAWNGRDGAGRPVPAGVYLLELRLNGRGSDAARIMILR